MYLLITKCKNIYKQFNNIMRGSPVPHRLLTKLMTCDHKKPNFTVLFLRHIHIVYSFTLLEKKKSQGGKRGFHSPLFSKGKGTLMLLHFSTSTLLRDTLGCKKIKIAIYQEFRYSPNVSTTPITAIKSFREVFFHLSEKRNCKQSL